MRIWKSNIDEGVYLVENYDFYAIVIDTRLVELWINSEDWDASEASGIWDQIEAQEYKPHPRVAREFDYWSLWTARGWR